MPGKSQLLEELTSLNRGISASAGQKQAILSLITQLEERNPTPAPAQASELLEGDWELRYTTSSELLGIDRFPLLKLGRIYQCIRVDAGRIYNLAEVNGFAGFDGLVSVAARLSPALDESAGGLEGGAKNQPDQELTQTKPVSDRRLLVQFERGIFGLQRWVNYKNPQQFIPNIQTGRRFAAIDFTIQGRQGWVDLTYLDRDLRINRGNEGSIFVLTRA